MKKCILLALFISAPVFAGSMAIPDEENVAMYQELCAKERDPLKRHNYCYLIEHSSHPHTNANVFRLDRAIV